MYSMYNTTELVRYLSLVALTDSSDEAGVPQKLHQLIRHWDGQAGYSSWVKCVRCKKDAPPRLAKLEAKYRPANHVRPGAVTALVFQIYLK